MNKQTAIDLMVNTYPLPLKYVGRFRGWYAFVPETNDLETLFNDPHYVIVGNKGQIREHHAPQIADDALGSSNYAQIEGEIGYYGSLFKE